MTRIVGRFPSNLYRVFLAGNEFDVDIEEHFDIEVVEAEVLEMAKTVFTKKQRTNLNILPKFSTMEVKTNLIDFTEDYLVALFMACNSSFDKDGRVYFAKKKTW